jgi:voltage-gated potassium channel
MRPSLRLVLALSTLVVLVAVSTIAYSLVMGLGFLDALYMTIITVTTIGFREVGEMNPGGQVVTIVVGVFGVALAALALGSLTEVLVAGSVRRILGSRRMEKQIGQLKDHYVICGYGRMGQVIARELLARDVPTVVIDVDVKQLAESREQDQLYVKGDATEDETLLAAGIERAHGLVAVLPSDAQNAFVTMCARDLAPGIEIIARAEEEGGERRLRRAGANRVVSPYEIGARRLALSILRPSVMDFIELVTVAPGRSGMQLCEVRVDKESDLVGKSLIDSEIRSRHEGYVIALKKAGQSMRMNPPANEIIESGDVLILIGAPDGMEDLERRAGTG